MPAEPHPGAAGPVVEHVPGDLLRATAEVLWAAARPVPDPEAVRTACHDKFDAVLLADAAIEQRVAPLVWQGLGVAGCQDRLGESADRLRADAAGWHARAHFVAGALAHAVSPLLQSGLEPVVLKGPALADRYPDPSLRPVGDIDLLLPSRDHGPALDCLKRAGWSVTHPLDRLRHETMLVHPDVPTLSLELHQGLDRWHNRITHLDGTALWRRRRPQMVLGSPAFTLTPEDELLLLAVHAGKPFHSFNRLVWFADLVVVIDAAKARAVGGLDWDQVRGRARRERCSTVLAVTLSQARRLGADVPEALVAGIPSRGWRRSVLDPVLRPGWPLARPDAATRRRTRYALSETWGRRMLLFVGETPDAPLWRQPILIGQRARQAAVGLPRLHRQGH